MKCLRDSKPASTVIAHRNVPSGLGSLVRGFCMS
jgi:hypothetical protein